MASIRRETLKQIITDSFRPNQSFSLKEKLLAWAETTDHVGFDIGEHTDWPCPARELGLWPSQQPRGDPTSQSFVLAFDRNASAYFLGVSPPLLKVVN